MGASAPSVDGADHHGVAGSRRQEDMSMNAPTHPTILPRPLAECSRADPLEVMSNHSLPHSPDACSVCWVLSREADALKAKQASRGRQG